MARCTVPRSGQKKNRNRDGVESGVLLPTRADADVVFRQPMISHTNITSYIFGITQNNAKDT